MKKLAILTSRVSKAIYLGCAMLSPFGLAIAADRGMMAYNDNDSGVQVARDPSRTLIVIGYDHSGSRVAQIFPPQSSTPSAIINLDSPEESHPHIPYLTGKLNPDAYARQIDAACKKYGVDPSLARAVVHAESSFNPSAVSPVGAAGLMQLMPKTAERFGVGDRFNPEQNIDGGVQYLSILSRMFGDTRLAVAAYNAGENAVARYGGIPPYQETQAYVVRVMSLWQKYKERKTVS